MTPLPGELPGELQALLDRERSPLPIPDDASERIAGQLAVLPVVLPGLSSPASLGRRFALLFRHRLTVGLVGLGLGGGLGARLEAARLRPAAAPAPAVASARELLRPVESPPPLFVEARSPVAARPAILPSPRQPAVRRRAPKRPPEGRLEAAALAPAAPPPAAAPARPAAPPGADSVAAEREILEIARTALLRRDPVDALEALDRHARSFPAGALIEERESLRIQALAVAGRRDEALQALGRLETEFPGSLSLPGLRAGLAEIP